MDTAKLLLDIERSAVFLGSGKKMRERIAGALTELTGDVYVTHKRPSGAIEVVRRAQPATHVEVK